MWPSGGYRNAGVCPRRRRKGGKRRLLRSRVAGHRANFCSRRVGTRRRRYDKKAGEWVRYAVRCGAAKSRFRARRSRLHHPTGTVNAGSDDVSSRRRCTRASLSATCCQRLCERKDVVDAPRDSRRLRTAAPALIYREGDPQVALVESRGQPLRWRTTVSTHALTMGNSVWGTAALTLLP